MYLSLAVIMKGLIYKSKRETTRALVHFSHFADSSGQKSAEYGQWHSSPEISMVCCYLGTRGFVIGVISEQRNPDAEPRRWSLWHPGYRFTVVKVSQLVHVCCWRQHCRNLLLFNQKRHKRAIFGRFPRDKDSVFCPKYMWWKIIHVKLDGILKQTTFSKVTINYIFSGIIAH